MIPYFSFHSFLLGPLTIQVWGLLVALGFLISLMIFWQKGRQNFLSSDKILNLSLAIVLFSLFFARLFYVLFGGDLRFFVDKPWLFFAFWQGGMSSMGGFFGAGLVLLWFLIKRGRGQKFLAPTIWSYLESLAYAFPFGWLIGRVGCFLIHDHPGKLTNSFFGVNFPDGARFDMALLEILALLPLAVIFLFLPQQENCRGKKFFAPAFPVWLLLWYGISRLFLDFWRASDLPNSDLRFRSLTLGQWGSIVLIILGIILWKKIRRQRLVRPT